MKRAETDSSPETVQASLWRATVGRYSQQSLIALLVLLNLCLTVPLAWKLNIWVDEAFSLHTTGEGIGYALKQALNFELQAPLYFVSLGLWRELNGSIFFARLFSIVCISLSIPVVAAISRRYLKRLHPGWMIALFALNPFIIAAAVNIRLYALVVLLSALLLLLFYEGYLTDSTKIWTRGLYVLLAVAALYTQYYTGFLLVANACALFALRRWRPLASYLLGMALAALCFLPLLPFIREQVAAHVSPVHNAETWFAASKFVTWRVKEYLLPVNGDNWGVWRRWFLRVLYLIVLYLIIRNRRRMFTRSRLNIWVIALVVAIFFGFTARITGENLLEARHTAVFFIPTILAVLAFVSMTGSRKVLLGWMLISFCFYMPYLYKTYRPMAKYGDWQRVASYVMSDEQPHQPLLVFHAGAALPLSYYYTGQNKIVPVPRENTFERFDFRDYVLHDEGEIVSALARAHEAGGSLWLITDDDCGFADLSYNCSILESFVAKHYRVMTDKRFHGSNVRLLQRKENGE